MDIIKLYMFATSVCVFCFLKIYFKYETLYLQKKKKKVKHVW